MSKGDEKRICGVHRSDGTICESSPVIHGTRCYQHGGSSQIESWKRRRLAADAEAEVRAAVGDPNTMNPIEPIALSKVILDRTPLVASEDEVRVRALTMRAKRIGGKLIGDWKREIRDSREDMGDDLTQAMFEALERILEPTDGDFEAATREIHTESIKLVAIHSARQVDARKAMDWDATIRAVVIPFLQELGIELNKFVNDYVEAGKRGNAMTRISRILERTLGLISQASQKDEPVPNVSPNR
jgi:hypothetical protein